MGNIILVAETGSDIPADLAGKHGIYLVPMHVTILDVFCRNDKSMKFIVSQRFHCNLHFVAYFLLKAPERLSLTGAPQAVEKVQRLFRQPA